MKINGGEGGGNWLRCVGCTWLSISSNELLFSQPEAFVKHYLTMLSGAVHQCYSCVCVMSRHWWSSDGTEAAESSTCCWQNILDVSWICVSSQFTWLVTLCYCCVVLLFHIHSRPVCVPDVIKTSKPGSVCHILSMFLLSCCSLGPIFMCC